MNPNRSSLPKGTVIAYRGQEATVLLDNGDPTLIVRGHDFGGTQVWLWELEGHVCKVISLPESTLVQLPSEGLAPLGSDKEVVSDMSLVVQDLSLRVKYLEENLSSLINMLNKHFEEAV
jgi:hypothetical protein